MLSSIRINGLKCLCWMAGGAFTSQRVFQHCASHEFRPAWFSARRWQWHNEV